MTEGLNLRVTKRNGSLETVSFDKITKRLGNLSKGLSGVSPIIVAQKTIASIFDGITTREIDILTADIAISLATDHPDYGILASNILISNLHKETSSSILSVFKIMNNNLNVYGEKSSLVADDVWQVVKKHSKHLDSLLNFQKDYTYDYFAIKTLEKMYLTKVNGKVVERPQHMLLRVALGIWKNDMPRVEETYKLLSDKLFTHASPTLFNASMKHAQLSSCFDKDTEVFIIGKGIVHINEVQLGDLVITHTGKVQKVLQLHQNPLGERKLYNLKATYTPAIKVTENHRLMVISKDELALGVGKGSWKPVSDIHQGDFLSIPKKVGGVSTEVWDVMDFTERIDYGKSDDDVKFSLVGDKIQFETTFKVQGPQFQGKEVLVSHKRGNLVNRFWTVDQDFAWFMGVWYGDGCVTHGKNRKDISIPKNIQIVSSKTNPKLITKICEIGEKVFGFAPSVSYCKSQDLVQIVFHSRLLAIVFKHVFGHGFDGKHLMLQMHAWDAKLVRAMLGGLVSSDGCLTKQGQIIISLSNYRLLKEFYFITRNVGILTSFAATAQSHKPEWKHHKTWTMRLLPDEEIMQHVIKFYDDDRMSMRSNTTRNVILLDGQYFVKVTNRDLVVEDLPEYVYTLGIEEDHSYNVEGIVCENCFLLDMEDSIDGIYKVLTNCARISKYGGGIGVNCHSIRSRDAIIRGTNGSSTGIIPMLRTFNATARYVNQGSRRNGSIAFYLEPHHPDLLEFIAAKRNHGNEEERARDLFYALWVSDLFMKRVENDEMWSFMDPDKCKGLCDVYGDEYEALYIKYESEGRYAKQVKAQEVWYELMVSQIETGSPYVVFKDSVNRKSNQKNVGVIKSSNLCSEITEFTSPTETAVCNLNSLSLPGFVQGGQFDFHALYKVTKVCARNLDRVIDVTFYPIEEARRSNLRHRPIGIGVQGLADVFIMMKYPFESEEAMRLNREIFETIYFAALETSMELAKENGAYETFKGSPTSEGILQCDLWDSQPTLDLWDWKTLRKDIITYGLRNSLSTAVMPTASTSQLLGNNECIEPYTSNMYLRRTLAGEFVVINKHLVRDLIRLGIWDKEIRDDIIRDNGSVQSVSRIPDDIKELYKTAWEIKQKTLVDMAISRGAFVCQSQSLNIFMGEPSFKKLSSMLFYGWKGGIKTGIYYLRSRGSGNATKVVVDSKQPAPIVEEEPDCVMCSG